LRTHQAPGFVLAKATSGLLTAEGGSCPHRTSGKASSFTAQYSYQVHARECQLLEIYFAAFT
jgi:hypothetical protein